MTQIYSKTNPLTDKKFNQRQKAKTFRDDWWGKSLAGLIVGVPLSFFLVNSLFYTDLASQTADGNVQLTMWFTVIVWLCVQSGVYLFGSAKSAWKWLTVACGVALLFWWWVAR